jgi:hypothetical protein
MGVEGFGKVKEPDFSNNFHLIFALGKKKQHYDFLRPKKCDKDHSICLPPTLKFPADMVSACCTASFC